MARPLFTAARRRGVQDDRILPLINVVFLLLVFFMLAGRLAVSDPFPVQPPASVSTASGVAGEVVVHVAADGALAVNGLAADLNGLAAMMLDRKPSEPVRVKADAQAEALAVVRVLDRLRAAGIERVNLVTQARGG